MVTAWPRCHRIHFPKLLKETANCISSKEKYIQGRNIFKAETNSMKHFSLHISQYLHEFHETCHSVTFHFINKVDSKQCYDTSTPESIHTKDESHRGSAFAFIFVVNWPVKWDVTEWQVSWKSCLGEIIDWICHLT